MQEDFEKFVRLNAMYLLVTFETKSLSNYFCFFLNKPIIPWNQIQNSWFHVNFVTKINDMCAVKIFTLWFSNLIYFVKLISHKVMIIMKIIVSGINFTEIWNQS